MSSILHNRLGNPWVAALLVVILTGLAWLQYRWIGEVSLAERDRLSRGLAASATLFRRDFNRDLQRLAEAYWIDPRRGADLRTAIVDRFERRRAAGDESFPLSGIYLRTREDGGEPTTERLNFDTLEFETVAFPQEIASIADGAERRRRGPWRPGSWTLLNSGVLATALAQLDSNSAGGDLRRSRTEALGGLYLQLDMERIGADLFPRLTERYFGAGQDARVTVLSSDRPGAQVLFGEARGGSDREQSHPEFLTPLLWSREEFGRETAERLRDRFRGRPDEFFRSPDQLDPPASNRPRRPGEGRGPGGRGGPGRGERGRGEPGLGGLFSDGAGLANIGGAGPDGWTLAVGTTGGSLDDLVAQTRRRNLAVSFGVLLLLGAGLAMVLVSTRRAQRLAEMQMEFVAGVSHELRTPLAVIRSAGENLAEGVVTAPDQVKEYGALVRDHGRRLTEMVEQTLELAGAQAGKRVSAPEAVDLTLIVEESLTSLQGASVDREVPADLPPAWADPRAVRLALRNLLENAQKYGGPSGWIGIEGRTNGDMVEIRVRDRGPGIAEDDLQHVFEPFYRGRRAIEDQTRGAGLGLSLAFDAIEESGGAMRVESQIGVGTVFTIQLPTVSGEQQ